MKKRILFVTEASYLNSGYSVYTRQVMNRLLATGKYELAELSCYGKVDDPERANTPWKTYPNTPDDTDTESCELYNSSKTNHFGAWRFERVCLDFKPDIVCTIRDFWMDAFIRFSPFRRLFKWIWMPTVDAMPQCEDWLDFYARVDHILTYSEFGIKTLRDQCGDNIRLEGVASPAASDDFYPMDKKKLRSSLGIEDDCKIIGTVMRNQRRKLFPLLFEAFSRYIHENNLTNTYLYCHTSYPDNGWDLAKYLSKYNISSRVIFTYVCKDCKSVEICKFNDAIKMCNKCSRFSSVPSNVDNGVDDPTLCKVINLFDMYIQLANSEGFGLPQIEAAACNVPIACTNYSAMEDIVQKIGAFPIECTLHEELETGCMRAIPHMNSILESFDHCLNIKYPDTRDRYNEYYGWDKAADAWMKVIDKCDYADWNSPLRTKEVVDIDITTGSNYEFIQRCIDAYMLDNKNTQSIRTLIRDLNYGLYRPDPDGFFVSSSPLLGKKTIITREKIVEILQQRLYTNNIWEMARVGHPQIEIKDNDAAWLKW